MTFRTAGAADAGPLRDLERAANVAALGHVFPPERFPFPSAEVRARWVEVLADPTVQVEVVDGEAGLLCFAAWDEVTLRHLAVHPDRWGTGLARAAVARAVDAIRAGGGLPLLWCLADNGRAWAVYEHLGWRPTGRRREAVWPPYPVELELALKDSSRA